jgi:hypothetical protein
MKIKYELDFENSYLCNVCEKEDFFYRYIDTTTTQQIASHVGKCTYCEYEYTPESYFLRLDVKTSGKKSLLDALRDRTVSHMPSFVPKELVEKSIDRNLESSFSQYLKKSFGLEVAKKLVEQFFIGTLNEFPNSTVLWQRDEQGNFRTGKVVLFDVETCKQFKEVGWAHVIMKLERFRMVECMFGLHQLTIGTSKPVAIAEKPETAVIASILYPDYLWLACDDFNLLRRKSDYFDRKSDVTLFRRKFYSEEQIERFKNLGFNISSLLIDDLKANFEDYLRRVGTSPLSILSVDIATAPVYVPIGNITLSTISTKCDEKFDFFLDEDGQVLKRHNTTSRQVSEIQRKRFREGYYNNQPCLIYKY